MVIARSTATKQSRGFPLQRETSVSLCSFTGRGGCRMAARNESRLFMGTPRVVCSGQKRPQLAHVLERLDGVHAPNDLFGFRCAEDRLHQAPCLCVHAFGV